MAFVIAFLEALAAQKRVVRHAAVHASVAELGIGSINLFSTWSSQACGLRQQFIQAGAEALDAAHVR